jgi:DNA-directed RNA polymerase specialized sigma24 family protein
LRGEVKMKTVTRKYLLQAFVKYFTLNHSELIRRGSNDEEIVSQCFEEVVSILNDHEVEELCGDLQKRIDLLELDRINDRIYFELIKQGNYKAILDLMEIYTPRLRFYFYGLLGKKFIHCNEKTVNDVIASEWYKLWFYRDKYDYTIAKFLTYFTTIIYNALRDVENKLSKDAGVFIQFLTIEESEGIEIEDPIEKHAYHKGGIRSQTPEDIREDYQEGKIVLGLLFRLRLAPVWKLITYGLMVINSIHKVGYVVEKFSDHRMSDLLFILKREISLAVPNSENYIPWLFEMVHEDIEKAPYDLLSKHDNKSEKFLSEHLHVSVKDLKLKHFIKGEQTLSNWKSTIKKALRKYRLRQDIEKTIFFDDKK